MSDHHQTAANALAKCAAYDPWFPQPNRATVEAWAEQIAEYQLDETDVLAGVKIAYRDNGAGFRPLPRDIVQAARAIRRDRAEREDDAAREARQDRHDAELANFAARDAELANKQQRLTAMIKGLAVSEVINHDA